jgi:hypothetical protein
VAATVGHFGGHPQKDVNWVRAYLRAAVLTYARACVPGACVQVLEKLELALSAEKLAQAADRLAEALPLIGMAPHGSLETPGQRCGLLHEPDRLFIVEQGKGGGASRTIG